MSTTTNVTRTASLGNSEEVFRFVCSRDFHQSMYLPSTDSHERLRISYSTTSNFSDASLPAILFCSPMFGSRYGAMDRDDLARKEGVRFIYIDRPGMGGSTRVPLNQRFSVWLEAVAAVLEKLETPHVYLACHSAGTLYALQTMWYLRGILWPEKPYVAFIAPWVHNSHSSATLMKIAYHIPSGIIDGWSPLNRFIQQRIAPATSWSGGVISSVASLFQRDAATASEAETSMTMGEQYGTSEEVGEQISKLITKCVFAEDISAASEEAKICLRKEGVEWGVFRDFGEYVQKLSESEASKRQNEQSASAGKLKVRAFFAESDIMIGKGGRDYFNEMWTKNVGDEIDYLSTDLPEANHDSAYFDHNKGALKTVVREIKALHYQ